MAAHHQATAVEHEVDEVLVVGIVVAVPELVEKAIYTGQIVRGDGEMYGVPLALQLILEVVETGPVGQPHVGVRAADPFDRLEREGRLFRPGTVDPTLVAVAEHLAATDMTC